MEGTILPHALMKALCQSVYNWEVHSKAVSFFPCISSYSGECHDTD